MLLLVLLVLGLIPSCLALSSANKQCIIVGGGPVGLATALQLSNPPHSYSVTLLEQSDEVGEYDPTRAYLYNVNPRGLVWFDQFPNAQAKLFERGSSPVSGMGAICYVPPTDAEPIPEVRKVRLSRQVPLRERRSFWIPRHQMVVLLEECCREQEAERLAGSKSDFGSIELLHGKRFAGLEVNEDDTLTVKCDDGTSYTAALVIGADGMDSSVRACLGDKTQSTWLQAHADQFQVRRYRSPSTGLRMKSLQFPPKFVLRNNTGEVVPTDSETMYVLRSINKGTRDSISLGMLPVKDPTMVRPANINTRPDNVVWSMRTGTAIRDFFAKSFPRMRWDEIINDEEWERFAKADGTTYPYCQYSPGSASVSPSKLTGVVLVGDACHAFPPDIGQGINAGLNDVLALDRAMTGRDILTGAALESRPETLGDALTAYQADRGPEHKALIRLARCGAPYQYRQPWIRDRIGRFLWTANVAFRMMLNKLSGGLIPPVAAVLMQNEELSFRQVMRRAAMASRIIKLAILPLIWTVLKRSSA